MHFDLTDHYQGRSSLIHRLDPRVKTILTLSYLLGLSLIPVGGWAGFLAFAGLLLIAVGASGLDLAFTVRRSYIALPFVLAALPIIFIDQGDSIATLPGVGWAVSAAGLERFLSIMLRTWLGVQAGVLLTVTTRFPDLIWALGALRVPGVMVAIIAFMYRYLFILVDQALRMMQARAARSARVKGRPGPGMLWHGRVAGTMAGNLFLRSLERSERVYAAMASRGYDGAPRLLERFRMKPGDWLVLAGASLAILVPVVITNSG